MCQVSKVGNLSCRTGVDWRVSRYDHDTIPLAFSSRSAGYAALFPPSKVAPDDAGVYTPSLLPQCKGCDAARTYEYQLMPHLVTVLGEVKGLPLSSSMSSGTATTVMEQDTLDWATVMIFTCSQECVDHLGEAWEEEHVVVQGED